MTNPYHNSQYCINKRKTNQQLNNHQPIHHQSTPPYTGPQFGKKSGMSKGTIIAIVSGSIALIGGIVTAILSKKKTLVYKSVGR